MFDPIPETVVLSNGVVVRLLRLKTRQFFRMLRIVTRGAGGFLSDVGLSMEDSTDDFIAKLLGLLVIAIPEAENEAIEFIGSMVEPDGLVDTPKMSKDDKAQNELLWLNLQDALRNPELEDFIDIIEAIVRREASDMQALGKRLRRMFEVAQKVGLTKPAENPEDPEPLIESETVSSKTSSKSTPKVSSEDLRSALI